ncbi:ATP-binding protein [Actinomadura rupiterrae]|uniref:ATP-binding protein n=1 Tax=Actinomadura rupiterrae TaxID=559627 RepID=UPI0020A43175|nr:ATP-binding protein [Actinomadura rupiterrae]MCP2335653.1 anti-sigma regulatory factor (Ser/Thr protein kinase) [Actinomadura rupiterrae]
MAAATLSLELTTVGNGADVNGVVIEMGNPPGSVDSALAAGRVRAGECVAWVLPADETCAAVARRHLRGVMAALGLADELVYDASTMVSELAANVFVHALGGLPGSVGTLPELWLHRRREKTQLVAQVFDVAPWKGVIPGGACRPAFDSEGGRGLEVVDALAAEHGGEWGVHRSRARLTGTPASGKVAFFALPVGAAWPIPPVDVGSALRTLEFLLLARGLGPMHRCEGWNMGVLSVRAEITVWARPHGFHLTMPGVGTTRYALAEIAELAEVVVRCNEELDAGGGGVRL